MKPPSRRMPLAPVRKSPQWAWAVLVAMVSGLGYWLCRQPYGVLVAISLAVFICTQISLENRRRRKLAASRDRDGICAFARSFDRQTDTWIVRAVYEELSKRLSVDERPFPVRREDQFEDELGIDPEDLDDLAREISLRTGRSMHGSEKNPLYDKVFTVADLVSFFEGQPRMVFVETPMRNRSDEDGALIG